MTTKRTSRRAKLILISLGLLLGLIAIELGMRAGGWVFFQIQDEANRLSLDGSEDSVILCLGESTTALGGDDSYPSQLERILAEELPDRKIKVINKGIPGTRTSVILNDLEKNIRRYQPDIVVAMMGTNDGRSDILTAEPDETGRFSAFINNLRIIKLGRWLRERLTEDHGPDRFSHPAGDNDNGGQADLSAILKTARDQTDPAGFLIEKAAGARQDGRMELAGLLLEEVAADSWKRAQFWFERDLLLLEKREIWQAGIARRQGIKIDPEAGYNHLFTVAKKLGLLELWGKKREVLEETIKLKPGDARGYVRLAESLRRERRLEEAKELLETALEIEPGSARALKEMGRIIELDGTPDEALDYYRWAYEIEPFSSIHAYVFTLLKEDRAEEAEEITVRTLDIYPESVALLRLLAACYTARGHIIEAEKCTAEAGEKEDKQMNPETGRNYRRLKDILNREGIQLICVQYPMRPLAGLKAILGDKGKDVIFIDNEAIFREGVSRHGFDYYFWDQFGGNFGHATVAGNRLLAENIAGAIRNLIKSGE